MHQGSHFGPIVFKTTHIFLGVVVVGSFHQYNKNVRCCNRRAKNMMNEKLVKEQNFIYSLRPTFL